MVPQVEFDIVDSISRVLEEQEPGNDGLSSKYLLYIEKSRNQKKIQIFVLIPGVSGASLEGFQVE